MQDNSVKRSKHDHSSRPCWSSPSKAWSSGNLPIYPVARCGYSSKYTHNQRATTSTRHASERSTTLSRIQRKAFCSTSTAWQRQHNHILHTLQQKQTRGARTRHVEESLYPDVRLRRCTTRVALVNKRKQRATKAPALFSCAAPCAMLGGFRRLDISPRSPGSRGSTRSARRKPCPLSDISPTAAA